MVDPRYWCKSCLPCRSGATHVCQTFGFKGLSGGGGGLSELTAVHQDNAYPVAAEQLHLAALIEPLAVAWHGVTRAGTEALRGAPVLVLGGGPIGLAMCIVLRARGAEVICLSEPAKIRRELAASFADIVLDPRTESVSKKLNSLTNGEGIRLVLDCAGVQAGMDEGLKALRFRGVYLNLAGWTKPVSS
jgi:(R,R)-butanediol dehydrogenase/meso-butanediol dehydrogenase/diacetyl reductase